MGSVGGWRVSAVYSESVGPGTGNGQDTVVVLWVEAPGAAWCSLRLSLGEREEISRGVAWGESLRSIAERLGRSSSTVYREVKINGGCDRYRAVTAHQASRKRAKRPKAMKLETCPRLRSVVEDKLELWSSPAQISLWLETEYRDDEEMRVSHETIYQSLFV